MKRCYSLQQNSKKHYLYCWYLKKNVCRWHFLQRKQAIHIWAVSSESLPSGICGHWWLRSACATAQSHQGLLCPLTDWLDTTEFKNGEQRLRCNIAHAQDGLNPGILRMHFSLSVVLIKVDMLNTFRSSKDGWMNFITKTCLYNFDPLKPHFYIVKLGFTGVYIIFLISAQKHKLWYSLEPPLRGGSNEYPQSMFWAEMWKISVFFYLKNCRFLEVKFSIYLNRHVFVRCGFSAIRASKYFCWPLEINKWTQEPIQSDPHQAPNTKGKDRQIQLKSRKMNRWQAE